MTIFGVKLYFYVHLETGKPSTFKTKILHAYCVQNAPCHPGHLKRPTDCKTIGFSTRHIGLLIIRQNYVVLQERSL